MNEDCLCLNLAWRVDRRPFLRLSQAVGSQGLQMPALERTLSVGVLSYAQGFRVAHHNHPEPARRRAARVKTWMKEPPKVTRGKGAIDTQLQCPCLQGSLVNSRGGGGRFHILVLPPELCELDPIISTLTVSPLKADR